MLILLCVRKAQSSPIASAADPGKIDLGHINAREDSGMLYSVLFKPNSCPECGGATETARKEKLAARKGRSRKQKKERKQKKKEEEKEEKERRERRENER
jgi:hypothetical protein